MFGEEINGMISVLASIIVVAAIIGFVVMANVKYRRRVKNGEIDVKKSEEEMQTW